MTRSVLECPMDVFQELLGELLLRGERATFRVSGVSMSPTILTGDVITLERIGPSEVRTGDIIAFRFGASICVHRVIDIVEETRGTVMFRTAGDGNLHEDGPQRADDVVGRVVLVAGTRGTWRPAQLGRRIQGRLRVTLARRPGLRAVLRRMKNATSLLRLRGEAPA